MAHDHNKNAEFVLDREFPVLDHGFVTLVDYMGGDARIEQAARVSNQLGTRPKRSQKKLLYYLAEHEHWTPFEKVVLEFHIKAPLFVVAQWVRHRTGSFNQQSARYSIMSDEFYIPAIEDLKSQSKSNRQASGGELERKKQEHLQGWFQKQAQYSYEMYEAMLGEGLARQHARMVLPQNLYTEFFWTVNLRNLMHFIHLRDSQDAQPEIARYAGVVDALTHEVAPIASMAFYDCVINTAKIHQNQLREILTYVPDDSEIYEQLHKKLRV